MTYSLIHGAKRRYQVPVLELRINSTMTGITSAHARRKHTGIGKEDSDQARVPVACGKISGGKRELVLLSWRRRHWSPSPSWGTNAEAREMRPFVVVDSSRLALARRSEDSPRRDAITGVVVSELQDGSEKEEHDQRERRTGYRTGAGGTRGRRVRGRASEEEGGLRGGTAEGGSDVTGTHACWLSGNKHISDKGGQGGPGGEGHAHGTGGSGGAGLGPTVYIMAQHLTAHNLNASSLAAVPPVKSSQIVNHCPPPSRIFQGRHNILNKMQDFFTDGAGGQHIYVLYRLGGAGKTQIALKFIKELASIFSDIFLIDTSATDKIDMGLKNIAITKCVGQSSEAALQWLGSKVDNWLLFFDNADDPSIDLNEFLPQYDHGNIIITSRNRELCHYAGSSSLVSDLEEADAVALLLKSARYPLSTQNRQIASEIVKTLGYLALAIVQAGAFIFKSGALGSYLDLGNFQECIQMFSIHPLVHAWSQEMVQDPESVQCTVGAVLGMSGSVISRQDIQLASLVLLPHIESVLGENLDIRPDFWAEYAQIFSGAGKYKEARKLRIQIVERLRELLGDNHPDTLNIMNDLALTYRELGEFKKAQESQIVVLEKRKEFLGDNHPDTLNAMNNLAWTYRGLGDLKKAQELQIVAIENRNNTLNTMSQLAVTYKDLGEFRKAKELQIVVLEKQKQLLSDNHPEVLEAMNNLAIAYRDLGEFKKAQELQIIVLEKDTQILGDNHPDTLSAMHNLATIYRDLGEFKKAQELQIGVLEKRKEFLGDNHPGVLLAMHNLAATCGSLGEFKKARELQIVVHDKQKEILGDNHPEAKSGRVKRAQELQIVVLEKQKEFLGDNHPDTLLAMSNLALTYRDLGEFKKAQELQIVVLEKQKEFLGDNHPGVLLTMNNLALTYRDLGEFKKAQELQIVVLEKQNKFLGNNHPQAMQAMSNLALTYRDLGEFKKAQELQIFVLEQCTQILGDNHPGTLSAMHNLAMTYRDLGEFKKAQELQIGVLEKRKEFLGDNHPDSLHTMNNLALTYRDLGEFKKAQELQIVVLKKREDFLGDHHPDTLHTMHNLALTYGSLGEFKKAQDLQIVVLKNGRSSWVTIIQTL
ncbi:hypothetical protein B0H14DRAFT_3166747 [Mycena olivaceomarginata]|nr:hypothetical protein B0H14DRAFT_3166747 [Mycena olivaceomarginata]